MPRAVRNSKLRADSTAGIATQHLANRELQSVVPDRRKGHTCSHGSTRLLLSNCSELATATRMDKQSTRTGFEGSHRYNTRFKSEKVLCGPSTTTSSVPISTQGHSPHANGAACSSSAPIIIIARSPSLRPPSLGCSRRLRCVRGAGYRRPRAAPAPGRRAAAAAVCSCSVQRAATVASTVHGTARQSDPI